MASRTQTILVDDITGKEIPDGDGETITFAVKSGEYSIDLDAKGAKKFYDAVGYYVEHATKVGRTSGSGGSRARGGRRKAADADPAAIRVWAAENGIEVSPRGRISAEVVERYHAAGN